MRRTTHHQGRRAALAILCALGMPAAGLASAQETEPRSAAEARDESGRALKRILHLAGGTTLRAVTRLADGAWQYKQSGGWKSIPAAGVHRAVLEKDALSEMRRLKKDAGKDDLDRRAALLDWMFNQGLLKEGTAELERVLALDPDHGPARASLARHLHRFRLPVVNEPRGGSERDFDKALAPLFAFAGSGGHTGGEMAIHVLAGIEGREALQAALARALHASSTARRGFAAFALRRLFPGQEVRPLLARAVLDTSGDVRRNAALALRDVGEPGLVAPVVRALHSSSSGRVRLQAAEALGNMGYASAVEPLVARLVTLQRSGGHGVPHSNIFIGEQFAYIQDFDVEVAQFQAVADPQINVLIQGQATDAGVQSIGHAFFTSERRAVHGALRQLTGANPGGQVKDWTQWLAEHERALGSETPAR